MSSVLTVKTYFKNSISELTYIISSSNPSSSLMTTYSKQLNSFILFNQIFLLAAENVNFISDTQIIEHFQDISHSFMESCKLHTPIPNSSWSIYLNTYTQILNLINYT